MSESQEPHVEPPVADPFAVPAPAAPPAPPAYSAEPVLNGSSAVLNPPASVSDPIGLESAVTPPPYAGAEANAYAGYEQAGEAASAAAPAAEQGPENVGRGILFSLAVIPVGVILWTLIWSMGFIAAIVAFAVAFGAAWLYQKGSGGRVGAKGIVWIIVVTLVTLVIAFFAGIAASVASESGLAFGSPQFWAAYQYILSSDATWSSLTRDILMSLLFAALGIFSAIRGVMQANKARRAAESA